MMPEKVEPLMTVMMWDEDWRKILNLLTEELDYWEDTAPEKVQIKAIIAYIETQTGIRKKGGNENSKSPSIEEMTEILRKMGQRLVKRYSMSATKLMNAFGDGLHDGMIQIQNEIAKAIEKVREKQ